MTLSDCLRSFGMSAMQITADIRRIGERFNVDLGHETSATESAVDPYPQFEQAVRFKARRMAEYYEVFYCLENSIRALIADTMSETSGGTWWDTKVPQAIKDEVQRNERKEAESGHTKRSERPIDYTTFGQLVEIIDSNWDVFGAIFTNRQAVKRVLTGLNGLRAPIAHCCPLAEDEIARLQLAVRDWFRLMGPSD